MDAIRLGPLYIPIAVAVSLAAVLVATLLAEWYQRRRGVDPGAVLWWMIPVGFLVARIVFVVKHHDIYLAAPMSAFDIRDGGFEAVAGLIAACVVGAELTRRTAALRRPVIVCVLAGCVVWFGGTLAGHMLAPAQAPMPDLMVRQLDGREVALRSFGNRPVVLNLWATWCPPCRREMPALMAAQAANPQVAFVFVNQDESAATVESFLARQGLRMHNVVLDPGGRVAAGTGALGLPTTLFYGAKGELTVRHVGELSSATLVDKLASIQP